MEVAKRTELVMRQVHVWEISQIENGIDSVESPADVERGKKSANWVALTRWSEFFKLNPEWVLGIVCHQWKVVPVTQCSLIKMGFLFTHSLSLADRVSEFFPEAC